MSVKWISHRGYHENIPENTLEAFQRAREHGFSAIETDLRMSKDGHIVLCHDLDFSRMGGPDRPVITLTRTEIETISLNGGTPCFFDQLIAEFADISWTFDIKPEHAIQVIEALEPWIHCFSRTRTRFLFWSKAHESLFHQAYGPFPCYARQDECLVAGLAMLLHLGKFAPLDVKKTYSLPPSFRGVNLYRSSIIEAFKKRGVKLLAFLPKTSEQTRLALELGFDEILTDGQIL